MAVWHIFLIYIFIFTPKHWIYLGEDFHSFWGAYFADGLVQNHQPSGCHRGNWRFRLGSPTDDIIFRVTRKLITVVKTNASCLLFVHFFFEDMFSLNQIAVHVCQFLRLVAGAAFAFVGVSGWFLDYKNRPRLASFQQQLHLFFKRFLSPWQPVKKIRWCLDLITPS